MTKTETKKQLNLIFTNLIKETNPELFNKYKTDFYKILTDVKFENYDTIDMQIGLFEITCNSCITTDFNPNVRKLLFGDFEMILITLDESLFDE